MKKSFLSKKVLGKKDNIFSITKNRGFRGWGAVTGTYWQLLTTCTCRELPSGSPRVLPEGCIHGTGIRSPGCSLC